MVLKSRLIFNRKIILTHFQPTYARNAFPCFDEPSFKAIFILQLIYPKKYNVVSNTAQMFQVFILYYLKTFLDDYFVKSEFDTTIPISTYLLGFVLFEFKSITTKTDSGVDVIKVFIDKYMATPKIFWESRSRFGIRIKIF